MSPARRGRYHGVMKPITLSFDNGPEPAITSAVLDLLDTHDIRTTCFVVGQKLDAGPAARAVAERAHRTGHWIGNHSYTHSTPLGALPADAARDEIERTQDALGALAHPDKLFRPFGGGGKLGPHLLNAEARRTLVDGGYTCVTWNAIPRDWDDPTAWPARAKALCADLEWPLMVLHDMNDACLDGLDGFLTWLKAEGYEIHQDFPDACVPIRNGRADADLLAPNGLAP